MKYNIYAGLGGGFGGARLVAEAEEFENRAAAENYAYECALEDYQSYEGYHGIVSYGDIWENPEDYGLEEGYTEEDVEEIYQEEVESWITYYVEEVK
jgi:hypothetical protein